MKFDIEIPDDIIARLHAGERISLKLVDAVCLTSPEPKPKRRVLKRGAVAELLQWTDFLATVTDKLQRDWIRKYGVVAITTELSRAEIWYDNAAKKPKNVGSFVNNWLMKAMPAPVAPSKPGKVYE